MTIATANGVPCLRLETRMPRTGVWFADLVVDQGAKLSGAVEISLAGGALNLEGTVAPTRTGLFAESAVLRVLAGAGRMGDAVPKKWYRSATVRIVVQDLLSAVGEKLSSTADANLLSQQLQGWAHKTMPAAAALSRVCEYIGAVWRSLPDGTIWIGTESWPAAAAPGDMLFEDPRAGRTIYGTEAPTILPGTSLGEGRYISQVEHFVSSDEVKNTVTWETAPAVDDLDREARIEKIIFDHLAARFEWLGLFTAKVVKQNSDNTLELQMDDDSLPGLTGVPITYGVAGSTTKLKTPIAATALVIFENADPGRPRVVGWASADVDTTMVPGSTVKLGSDNAAKALALAQETKARLDTIQSTFDGHTQTGTITGTANSAAPSPAQALDRTNGKIGSLAAIDSHVAVVDS